MKLSDLKKGDKISFVFREGFTGEIFSITPTGQTDEDGESIQKYLINPIRQSDGVCFCTLALYDGDEDEFQVQAA